MNPEACTDAESTADDHKPQVIAISPLLLLSLTPPLWLGGYHTGSNVGDIPTSPPLPPPLHPLRWGMSSRCDSSQDVEQAPVSCLHLFPPAQISDRGFLEPGNWTAQLTDWRTGRKRGLAFAVSTSKFPSQSFLPQARQRRRLLNSNWSVLLWWLLLMQSLEMIMSINVSVIGQMDVIAWVEGWFKRRINS